MNLKKLRESLPKYGYIPLINAKVAGEGFSRTYISNVLNEVAYNEEIINAAIAVAKEYQVKISKQERNINKLK